MAMLGTTITNLDRAVAGVKFIDRAEIDIGFARAGLHLDAEIAPVQLLARREAVALLDLLHIGKQGVVGEGEEIAAPQLARQFAWPTER